MKQLIIIILSSVFVFGGCGLYHKTPNSRQISRYEQRIKQMYSDSLYTKVIHQEGLNVTIEKRSNFPYLYRVFLGLDDSTKMGHNFTLEYSYTNPDGKQVKAKPYKYRYIFKENPFKMSVIRGDGVYLEYFFDKSDMVEGLYQYHEKFIMGDAGYELISQFYFDPMTMEGAAGNFENNGYWMSERPIED